MFRLLRLGFIDAAVLQRGCSFIFSNIMYEKKCDDLVCLILVLGSSEKPVGFLPKISPDTSPQPFLPFIAPSPMVPYINSSIPKLSGLFLVLNLITYIISTVIAFGLLLCMKL